MTKIILAFILSFSTGISTDFPISTDVDFTKATCTKVGNVDRCGIDCGNYWGSCVKGGLGYSCSVYFKNHVGEDQYAGQLITFAPVCGH